MAKDLMKYVAKNMLTRLTQSSLTVLSILMGIMAIFALLSFGQGLTNYIGTVAEDFGTDKLTAQPRGAGPPGASGTFLSEDDQQYLEKQAGVEYAVGFIFQNAEVQSDLTKRGRFVFVTGMPSDADSLRNANDAFGSLDIIEGRLIESDDTGKVVLGYNYKQPDKIFAKPLALGDKIYVNKNRFEVIGFYDEVGNPQDDANVIMLEEDALRIFGLDEPEYGLVYIKAEKGADPSELADYLTERLRKEKDLEVGQETFSILTLESQLEMFNQIFGVLNGILVLIAGVSILVAAVNIMNTMYTAVMERTKEIGVMKAIGASNHYIMSVFVSESGMLGLIGGLMGILLGYGVAKFAGALVAAAGYSFLKPAFPIWLTLGCLFFAMGVGLISGFFPAKQASKLKPVDALRYE